MTTSSSLARSSGAESSSIHIIHLGQVHAGPFMLTLCQMQGPVSFRPPESPQLKRFTFLATSTRDVDGGEQVYLHMGYFDTLADAQTLLSAVRRRFPEAIASRTPPTLPQAAVAQSFAPVADESLTDTQVMRILEKRSVVTPRNEAEDASSAQIGVLRPEDTSTRLALKDAVVQGAPVYFAVQLDWSAKPINPDRVASLPLFKIHTLYAAASRREGRCRYFLRLGFFADAASAKEAALGVRSRFASAVVVPVTEEEVTRARDSSTQTLGFAEPQLPTDYAQDRGSTQIPVAQPGPLPVRPRKSARKIETLEQTLKTLAAREMWNDPDSLSDTGVRHLKVEVLEGESGGS